MRLLYFSRDYTTHDHRFLSALAKTEHQVAYLRLERRGHQLEERSLPPEIEIVQWRGGKAPVRWQDGLHLLSELKKVLRRIQADAVLAGPIQRTAFLAALAGFRPLVSMSWGYDLLQDARTQRCLELGYPLHFETQRRPGGRLQYNPTTGDSLWHAGRADRHLPVGDRPGAFHTGSKRTPARGYLRRERKAFYAALDTLLGADLWSRNDRPRFCKSRRGSIRSCAWRCWGMAARQACCAASWQQAG